MFRSLRVHFKIQRANLVIAGRRHYHMKELSAAQGNRQQTCERARVEGFSQWEKDGGGCEMHKRDWLSAPMAGCNCSRSASAGCQIELARECQIATRRVHAKECGERAQKLLECMDSFEAKFIAHCFSSKCNYPWIWCDANHLASTKLDSHKRGARIYPDAIAEIQKLANGKWYVNLDKGMEF